MYIEIDLNPTPSEIFFISVGINDYEAISFDCTQKGKRVIKQRLINTKQNEKSKQKGLKNSGWDVVVLKNGEFVEKYHVDWVDNENEDIVNDETWQTVWEKSLDSKTAEKLLYYSRLISDKYKKLGKHKNEIDDFQNLIKNLLVKFS